jgi:hypothetical protein
VFGKFHAHKSSDARIYSRTHNQPSRIQSENQLLIFAACSSGASVVRTNASPHASGKVFPAAKARSNRAASGSSRF